MSLYGLECVAENCSLTLVVFVAQPNFMLRGCEGCGQQYQFDRTLTHSVGILMNISHLYMFIV